MNWYISAKILHYARRISPSVNSYAEAVQVILDSTEGPNLDDIEFDSLEQAKEFVSNIVIDL